MRAFFLIGSIFFKLGAMGANVLVEFEKKILTGGIFFLNWGQFFLSWGKKIILGSRKSAFLGIILTPADQSEKIKSYQWYNKKS